MKTRKNIALLLALVLCLGVLAGCNTTPAETTASTTQGTTAATEGTTAATEPVVEEYSFEGKTLDIYTVHDLTGLPLEGFIEDALGLDAQWYNVSDEQRKALMTEKVTPSLLFQYNATEGHTMGRYGAYINLYDYYDMMPNFFAHYEAAGEQIKLDYETGEGELYTAPAFLNGTVQQQGWYYREDIFEELNLEVPTNWEEFLAVCEALKQAYPDSYPFCLRAMTSNMSGLENLAPQFGVNYEQTAPSLDPGSNTLYNGWTTDEARNMLKMLRTLIEKGYCNVASLGYTTALWNEAMASGESFITHGSAFHLGNVEDPGKTLDENYSLNWFNNISFVESDLPYLCRSYKDYGYGWSITSKCPDVELAVRYLDWLYSEEGALILSWGKEGESFGVNADGSKYFLEGYDATFQGRYQDSGYIDMAATAAAYNEKTQAMIFDTMENSAENFYLLPSLSFNDEEQMIIDTYHVGWYETKNAFYQKFLLGQLDIDSDADWAQFIETLDGYHNDEILECYNNAYARYLAGEK